MKAIVFLLLLFLIACTENRSKYNKQQKELTIKFVIDDTIQNIRNDYRILLINALDTLVVETKDSSIYLPEIESDKKYDLIFLFAKSKLVFKNLAGSDLIPHQKVLWEMGIDNKPFNKLEGFLSHKDYQEDLYHKVEYFRFNLLEYGDGIQVVNKY